MSLLPPEPVVASLGLRAPHAAPVPAPRSPKSSQPSSELSRPPRRARCSRSSCCSTRRANTWFRARPPTSRRATMRSSTGSRRHRTRIMRHRRVFRSPGLYRRHAKGPAMGRVPRLAREHTSRLLVDADHGGSGRTRARHLRDLPSHPEKSDADRNPEHQRFAHTAASAIEAHRSSGGRDRGNHAAAAPMFTRA